MVKLARDKAVKIDLGWKCQSCVVSYNNEVIKDIDTGEIYMIGVPREKAAWIPGLATLSWLTKIIRGKIDVGHCCIHKKQNDKPCEPGKEFIVFILELKFESSLATELHFPSQSLMKLKASL
jgi:hypothetical protein